MFKFFRKLSYICSTYDALQSEINDLQLRVKHLECDIAFAQNHVDILANSVQASNTLIKKATTVHADINTFGQTGHTVIVAGQYNNTDYVEVFNVHHQDFEHVVRLLRDIRRHAGRGVYDTPPSFDMAVLRRINEDF